MASAQWSEVDALLNIKMLGFANRRRDLMSEAKIYYDVEKPQEASSNQPLEEDASRPFPAADSISVPEAWLRRTMSW